MVRFKEIMCFPKTKSAIVIATATECKAAWRALKEAFRYRNKRKIIQAHEDDSDLIPDDEWQFNECLSFLNPWVSRFQLRKYEIDCF